MWSSLPRIVLMLLNNKVTSKLRKKLRQIFMAFSEKLNFTKINCSIKLYNFEIVTAGKTL